MQSILDHVARLLNSRRGMLAHLPDYGMPDIQEIYQAMPASIDGLGQEIKRVIERYEPRLKRVEVLQQPGSDQHHRITFLIRGEITGGPNVKFFTMFTAAGDARVSSQTEDTP